MTSALTDIALLLSNLPLPESSKGSMLTNKYSMLFSNSPVESNKGLSLNDNGSASVARTKSRAGHARHLGLIALAILIE
jgi:hypothetical protein